MKENARLLRDDTTAHIFLMNVGNQGDNAENLAIVGESNPHRIVTIDEWRGVNSEILSPFVNELCKVGDLCKKNPVQNPISLFSGLKSTRVWKWLDVKR